MPPSIQTRFGDEAMWKKVWLFTRSYFHAEFLEFQKLFQTQKSFWCLFKANSFWRNSSDSYEEVFRSDGTFGFDFGEKYEVTFGWSQKFGISIWGLLRTVFRRKCEKHKVTSGRSQKVEISIWGLLRTVFRRKCEKHKVTSGRSQKVEISIWGLLRTVFKAFILFAWIMILFRMKKHCLPIQIARLWSERAWLGT